MKGILYGVGTGPGDPELLTLKALRIIKESDIIIIPSENPGNCASYRTVAEIWPRIAEKDLLCLTFPMTRDMEKRLVCCEKNADIIADVLFFRKAGGLSYDRRSFRLFDLRIYL